MPQHNEVYLTESFKERWQNIIEDVDISNVPIEYIDHLILHTEDDREFIVSVVDLLAEGINPQELEEELTYRIENYNGVLSIDYILNVDKISTDIQSTTDKTLKNL